MAGPTLSRTQEMAMIHRIFRREVVNLQTFVAQAGDGDTARAARIAAAVDEYVTGLHHHHSLEDELIWPKLHERASVHDELIDRMETQHHALDGTLTTLNQALPVWTASAEPADRDALLAAVAEHHAVLTEHLGDEESLVMPLVEEHLTAKEWDTVGKKGMADPTPAKMLLALGAILEDATPEERAAFMAKVPAPGRLLWRVVGKRNYEKQMAALRGTR